MSAASPSIPARLMLGFIRGYQFTFSTVMGKQCRFHPTCSHYAAEAIRRYGALKGGWMGMKRILRCHPWNPGGVDYVPDIYKTCDKHAACDKTTHHLNHKT